MVRAILLVDNNSQEFLSHSYNQKQQSDCFQRCFSNEVEESQDPFKKLVYWLCLSMIVV